jgi:hypothetical protein
MGLERVTSGKSPEVVLALEDGTVLGRIPFSIDRPDVAHAIPAVKNLKTGWRGSVAIPPHAKIRVFLDLMSSNVSFRQRCVSGVALVC